VWQRQLRRRSVDEPEDDDWPAKPACIEVSENDPRAEFPIGCRVELLDNGRVWDGEVTDQKWSVLQMCYMHAGVLPCCLYLQEHDIYMQVYYVFIAGTMPNRRGATKSSSAMMIMSHFATTGTMARG